MASIIKRKYKVTTPDGKVVVKACDHYTIQYRDAAGKIKRVKGYKDKAATKQLAAKLELKLARGEQDMVDTYAPHRRSSLAAVVGEYIAEKRAEGRDGDFCYNAEKLINRVAEDCGWQALGDITPEGFARWRSSKPQFRPGKGKGRYTVIGPTTLNRYLQTLSGFCNWCVHRRKVPSNPLSLIEPVEQSGDVRRPRRSLTEDEVVRLFEAIDTRKAQRPEPGAHRPAYTFMLATGLRLSETADLRWGDVRLNAARPFLKLRGAATKNRKDNCLPLRQDVAAVLNELRGQATDDERVFLHVPSIYMHKAYLAAAGIEYRDRQDRQVDIHALRHTFCTALAKAGVSLSEAMGLMRHTDQRLTARIYADAGAFGYTEFCRLLGSSLTLFFAAGQPRQCQLMTGSRDSVSTTPASAARQRRMPETRAACTSAG